MKKPDKKMYQAMEDYLETIYGSVKTKDMHGPGR
jgi:Mn-dependent DtxR family transcriptional regulator